MEEFYKSQMAAFDQIQRSKTNFNKDGEARKTKEYLEKKLAHIEMIWEEFIDTDRQMKDNLFDDHNSHSYWNERELVKKFYNNYRTELQAKLRTLVAVPSRGNEYLSINPPTNMPGSSTASHIPDKENEVAPQLNNNQEVSKSEAPTSEPTVVKYNVYISTEQTRKYKAQDVKMRLCYKLMDDAKDLLETDDTHDQLQHKLNQLDARMGQIEQLHEEILVDATPEEESTTLYFKEDYYSSLVNNFETLRAKITSILKKPKPSDPAKHEIKLRRIEVPQFFGDPLKWASFHDLFRRIIHENNDISDTVKMHQLKTTVLGSAGKIISHLEATGDNYYDAWKLLVNRYQNKRQLASNHVNAMLSFPVIHSESASAIKSLHDLLTESLHAIKNLGISTVSWNYIIIPIIMKKLDNETSRLLEMSIEDPKEMPTIENFLSFLERRFQALEATKAKPIFRSTTAPQPARVNACYTKTTEAHAPQTSKVPQAKKACVLCKQGHELTDCRKYQGMSTLERTRIIAQHQFCIMCLKEKHHPCPHAIRCLVCQGTHNTLLHSNNHPQRTMLTTRIEDTLKIKADEKGILTNHLVNQYEEPRGTLLATALIQVHTGDQQPILLRMLIDPGSQISFITEEASKQIKQPTKKTHVEISGVVESEITTATRMVNFLIVPRFSSSFSMKMEALILPKITRSLPEQHFDSRKWNHLNNLIWADPNYNQPSKVDILLGADYYPRILMNQVVKGNQGEPIAQQTELGWIIFGSTSTNQPSKIESLITLTDLDNQLKKFWELEEIHSEKLLTEEERLCEDYYQQTVRRGADGRYVVRLPLRPDTPPIGSSQQRALARFIQLEKRLSVQTEFSNAYHECIQEYFDKGHLMASKREATQAYYIPHHAVIKATSTTTKLRVVFDASAKTSNNLSLNEIQLVGPKLQEDLMSILLRWRKYKIAYTADIEKMYRQIKVHPDDQHYQKILWRDSPQEAIKEYQLTTVTFGMASAPYLAVRTLQQLASDEKKRFPVAAEIIRNDFYVDDLLSGSHNINDAKEAQNQLNQLLETGGFNLRKWASNHPKLIERIDPDSRALEPISFSEGAVKTLGLFWNPSSDTFEFKVQLSNKEGKMTKRKMLSESSKLFDPLGWLAPTIIQAKILMQTLWISGVSWDQELPVDIKTKCQQYYNSLPTLEKIRIPRWIQFEPSIQGELHGFCDASEVAYAAVIYFYDRSRSKATLLTSKTRVAPISTRLTLPKLELCGASLLAKLMVTVQRNMKIDEIPTYYWSDSMIVLSWVKNKPHKFKTFVANRVSDIQRVSMPSQWFYVKSSDNPADCASRGIDAHQLIIHELWWSGPKAVLKDAISLTPLILEDTSTQLEQKTCVAGATTTIVENRFDQLYLNHSDFNTIKRVMVYVMRFINKCRRTTIEKKLTPTANEIRMSTHILIQQAQRQHFMNEIHNLANQRSLIKTSKIKSLTPILKDNLLRVGGRVHDTAAWSYQEQHPIIIPKDHPIAKFLIQEAHQQTMHGGTQLTLAHLRNRYWIIHGRKLTRQFISKCLRCYRFNSTSGVQLMGNLPTVRITPGRPFLRTGVDYAGPLQIRTTKGRGHKAHKGYLAIFVCMTTKAIHIEPVSDLTTEAFIAAYKRFTARRGLCSDLYSDNGSNFVGARNQLERELVALLRKSSTEIASLLANDGTTWHFIPPATPHFGGIWEAAVKAVKKHLVRVIGETTLTFEELTTVTSQVEACLNSRPLAPITTDPTDLTCLTPGHFLIGTSMRAIPQDNVTMTNINGISRWKLGEKIKQDFWKRWQSEYLNLLQHRRKWTAETPNMKVGDLVLIKDDNAPPLKWPTGRVVEVHPGLDHKVRVVSLQGPGGALFKRPIHKLSPLPIESESEIVVTKTSESVDQQPQPSRVQLRGQPHREVKQRRVHHAKPVYKTTMRLTLILLGMIQVLFSPTTSLPTTIEPLSPDAGIYFYDSGTVHLMSLQWNIIINYNLTGYWEDIRSLEYYIKHLDKVCQRGWQADNRLKICDVITQQLDEQMREITSQNKLLTSTNKEHTRRKRDIGDTVGYILGDAFGIMTQRDASHIEWQLEKAEINEKYLLELIRNQTSIIDATTNIFKHEKELNDYSFRAINNQFLHLERRMDKVAADNEQYNKVQTITTFTIQIMLIMRRIAEKQRVIIDVILSSHRGHIHPALLTPQQLKEETRRIHDYVPATMQIPDGDNDNDLGHIYNILTVQTRVTSKNILFLVKVPLAYTQIYQLFNVIPIPTFKNGQLHAIVPTTELLIIDLPREHFARLTSRDLLRCVEFKPNEYLCNISPIYDARAQQSQCEVNLLTHRSQNSSACTTTALQQQTYWTQLNANKWIFTVSAPQPVNIICHRKVNTMTLNGSGILTLDAKCILKHNEFQLTAVEETSHKINSSIIRSIRIHDEENKTTPQANTPPALQRPKKDNNYTDRMAEVEEAISLQKLNEVQFHPIMDTTFIIMY